MFDIEAINQMTEEELNELLKAIQAKLNGEAAPAEDAEEREGEEEQTTEEGEVIAEMVADADLTDEDIAAIEAALEAIDERKKALRAQKRSAMRARAAAGEGKVIRTFKNEEKKPMNEVEARANSLMKNGNMKMRALLASGNIAKPTQVGGINPLADELGSIVDDVTAVQLTGNGAYVVAYEVSHAIAADVTDGVAIGGTESTYNYVTINPAEWGIVGQISRQVKKMSPLAYENAVTNAALYALRAKAEKTIYAAIKASSLAENVTHALDQDYLRSLFLGFKSIVGKGGVKLYLCRADLTTLAKVRGTNEKKALYDITFNEGSTTCGMISEGGFACPFCITEELTTGTQLFGQPGTVEMPMWDEYTIETDESRYFELNQIGYRGVQTANADLCAKYGMQIVANA